jgi:hypothetical protein
VTRVEHTQLVLLPIVELIGEQRTCILPRRPIRGEVVLHDPLPERFGDDGPTIDDACAFAQPVAVVAGCGRGDAIDHRVRKRAAFLDPRGQRRVEPRGCGQGRAPGRISVPGKVVAAQDRDRAGGAVTPDGKAGSDPVKGRALTGRAFRRRQLGVAGLRNGQRQDRRAGCCDEVPGGSVLARGRVNEVDD